MLYRRGVLQQLITEYSGWANIQLQDIIKKIKVMKKYNSRLYDYVGQALEDCNNHQDWNVINIYPTGWRQEKLCVVYYTTK